MKPRIVHTGECYDFRRESDAETKSDPKAMLIFIAVGAACLCAWIYGVSQAAEYLRK